MPMDLSCGKENLKVKNIFSYLKYKFNFNKENPDYFQSDGLLCFVGPQGSGKTLSAVNYVYNLLDNNPLTKLVTNIYLKDYPVISFDDFRSNYQYLIDDLKLKKLKDESVDQILYNMYLKENRVFPFVNNDDFMRYSNGNKGVVFLVDEIQLYMNSLESKNINMDVMTQISQQRKQRKHIVTTSQVFGRMAKPLREQFSNVILCKNMLGFIQKNCLIDRDSLDTESSTDTNITGKVKQTFLWFHNPKMYKRYDTYYVIERGKFVAGEQQKEVLYDRDRLPSNC